MARRLKKEAGQSRLVGGEFRKPGNLKTRLVLGSCKITRSPHLRDRILNVYIEALTAFSPNGLNNTYYLKVMSLKMAPTMEMSPHSKDGEPRRSF